MYGRESCCVPDHINDTVKVFKNIGIPKSDDPISVFLQFIGSLLIIDKALRFVMLPTIEFNNQLAIVARKVRDIFSNWNLAAKVTVLTFEHPKLLPHLLFCIGNIAAKLSRKLVSHLPTPTPNPSPQGGGEKNCYRRIKLPKIPRISALPTERPTLLAMFFTKRSVADWGWRAELVVALRSTFSAASC